MKLFLSGYYLLRAQDRISPKSNKQIRTWRIQTISHQAFFPLAELFIFPENGKKRILPDQLTSSLVQKHLTPQGLAYWYMDDGGLASRDRFATNLNTQGFQFHEVEILCEELATKFKLICWPKKNKQGAPAYSDFWAFLYTFSSSLTPEVHPTKWGEPLD